MDAISRMPAARWKVQKESHLHFCFSHEEKKDLAVTLNIQLFMRYCFGFVASTYIWVLPNFITFVQRSPVPVELDAWFCLVVFPFFIRLEMGFCERETNEKGERKTLRDGPDGACCLPTAMCGRRVQGVCSGVSPTSQPSWWAFAPRGHGTPRTTSSNGRRAAPMVCWEIQSPVIHL